MKTVVAAACVLLCAFANASELERARTLIKENKLDEARTILLTTSKDPGQKGESLALLTRVCTEKGEWDKAVDYGEQAVAAQPSSSFAHFAYAVALRLKMLNGSKLKAMLSVGDYKKALARSLELDPESLDAREEEIGFLLSAPGVAGGDVEKAKVKIAELKARDQVLGLYCEATLGIVEQKPQEAIKAFAAVLALRPEDHRARMRLVNLLQDAKRFEDAERELAVLAEVRDGTWALSATYQRARSRILGHFEQAKAVELLNEYIAKAPERAAELPPKSAAYWRLGNAFEQLKERTQARSAYEKALSLDPKNAEAKKALKALS
jgi:tetratricopeptide (TPR) repeat protein